MTVETQAIKAVYQGNGATTVFPYGFLIPTAAELRLSVINQFSGDVSIISPVNYSVTGLGNDAGGSVTYVAIPAGYTLVIERVMPYTQEITFANQGAAYPADIEDGLDILTLQTQQLADAVSRSIVFSVADTVEQTLPVASARANLLLGFDSNGAPIALAGIVPNVQVSAPMIPVVTAPSTAAALVALGLPGALLDLLIPAGTIWDYGLVALPNGFVFPYGQACTNTYPVLRAALVAAGSPYGTNGVDPLMPDLRSVVGAGKSNMGGTDNGLLNGGTVLGAPLGAQTVTLSTGQIPSHSHPNVLTDPGHTHTTTHVVVSTGNAPGGGGSGYADAASVSGSSITGITITNANAGGGGGHLNVQPTIVLNKIMKAH